MNVEDIKEFDMVPPEEYKRMGKELADAIDNKQYESVRDYVEKHKTDLNDDDITMYPKPKGGCKRCYGTGREGFDFFSGEPKICSCIMRRLYSKDITEFMSWKEFKALMLSKAGSRKTRHLTPKRLRRSLGKKVGKYAKLDSQISETFDQEEDRKDS